MQEYKRISVQTAKALLETDGVQIIDIRDEQSYASSHIQSSKHVDKTAIQQFIDDSDQTMPVVVCCYHGIMSQSAAAYLIQQGFDDVASLDGGFAEWSQTFPELCNSKTH